MAIDYSRRGAIGALLDDMDTDIESPEYGKTLNQMMIGRLGLLDDRNREGMPRQSNIGDRPLQDAGWRRWFDILKAKGVTKLGDASVGRKRGMFPGSMAALDDEPVVGPVNPLWADPQGAMSALRRQTGTGNYYESHDTFKKRYGR